MKGSSGGNVWGDGRISSGSGVNFKLSVETDGASDRTVFNPDVKPRQSVIIALTEIANKESEFSFTSESKFGLPTYLTQVTFGGSAKIKTNNKFWQIAVNKNGTVTPVGLDNYFIQPDDEVFLRFTTIKL
ncbi:unnamed protein product [Boreogadus saida]